MTDASVSASSFRPGHVWLDTRGNPIQAHGGSIIAVDGVYYWYGENKARTSPTNGIWHWGIRCYSSRDLYNWADEGLIIPPRPEEPTHPFHPAQQVDRPHIIFNERTGKFICWVKIMHRDGVQASTVLTADSILGPYEIVASGLRPLGMNAGDFDLVVDPSDQKAYYYFERVHSELICADLTEDYSGVSGYYSTHFPLVQPPFVREAPAYFRRHGKHYLITSGTTGYHPNPSEVAVAPSYHGPWTVLGDPHPSDNSRTSFRSQISSVFRHPEFDDLYIALGDRWVTDTPYDQPDIPAFFEERFRPGHNPTQSWEDLGLPDPDTSKAGYVWLPLRFDGDDVTIAWRDEWSLDEFTRV